MKNMEDRIFALLFQDLDKTMFFLKTTNLSLATLLHNSALTRGNVGKEAFAKQEITVEIPEAWKGVQSTGACSPSLFVGDKDLLEFFKISWT